MVAKTRRMPVVKQERSALSTSKLLDAAADLIAESGYERMTLAAIGERAGYSHGLVTARFGSKEGLLWALVQRMVEAAPSGVSGGVLDGSSGAEAIHAMLDEMRRSWRREPKHMKALYALMFEALLPIPLLNEQMRELHRELRAALERFVSDGIDAGTVAAGVDPARVARLVVGAIRGAVYQAALDPKSVPITRALDDVDSLVDALLPQP